MADSAQPGTGLLGELVGAGGNTAFLTGHKMYFRTGGGVLVESGAGNPFPVTGGGGGGAGASVALSSPAPTLAASADTLFTFSSPVAHLFLENKSNTPAYYNLDAAASPGSYSLPAGALRILDLPCTVLHLYSTAALAVNGTVDLNIVVGGWR